MIVLAVALILGLGSAALGWLLGRAAEEVDESNSTFSNVRTVLARLLWWMGFFIGLGGSLMAMEIIQNPDVYGPH
jgi:hypothetical protein